MESGLVFNIQKYSVHDGSGIRTTVFLKGCPLSCGWCHNPEGIAPSRQLAVLAGRCIRCGRCREACPTAAALGLDAALPPGHGSCQACGACAAVCPAEARQLLGRSMTVNEVLTEFLKDRVFYDDSQGGVTFSGGEPLGQPRFLLALLRACRHVSLHTAVDTCGFVRTEDLLAAAPFTDLFLYDLKLMDSEKHRRYTGAPNQRILENLKLLGRVHRNIWVRLPIIPGVNDSEADLDAAARFIAGIPGVRQINLLPYHRTGIQKLERLGRTPPLSGLAVPSPERLDRLAQAFRATGLPTQVGG